MELKNYRFNWCVFVLTLAIIIASTGSEAKTFVQSDTDMLKEVFRQKRGMNDYGDYDYDVIFRPHAYARMGCRSRGENCRAAGQCCSNQCAWSGRGERKCQ